MPEKTMESRRNWKGAIYLKKKVFCLLLALAMMISLFPLSAFAASSAERNADAALAELSDAEELPDRILIDATEILYAEIDGARQAAAVYSLYHAATDQTPLTYDYTMSDSSYPADGSYYLHLIAYGQKDAAMSEIGAAGIEKITLGLASSVEEFETAENLTEVLFTDASQTGGGYLADFSQGYVDFTIMDILGDIHYLRIQTVAASEDLPDKILIDATNILYAERDGVRQAAAEYSAYHAATDQTPFTYDYTMSDRSCPADGSYYLHLIAYGQKGAAMSEIGAAGIVKITLGLASSAEEFEAAENLTEVLFTDASQTGGGYLADFSQGYVDFTIMDILGDIHYLRIQTVGEIHESTEITAASRGASSDGNETWISASVTLDSQTACATIFCAAYQNGKMMEVFSQTVQNTQAVSSDPASWTETLTFTFSGCFW